MTSSSRSEISLITPLTDSDLIAEALRSVAPHVSSLALIIDDAPSMQVWAPTVTAFQGIVESAFAQVNADRLSPSRHEREVSGRPRGQLVLVVTDGLDDFWGHRPAAALLQSWGRQVPVAIVNPYPQERWHRTHLAPRLLQLSAPRALSPNAELDVREPGRWKSPFDEPLHGDAVAVPLLELTPRWLSWWASLVNRSPGGWLDAVAYIADPERPDDPDGAGPVEWPAQQPARPQDLVFGFRAGASAEAFRLATYIASAPLDLGAMRVIQGALLPESHPVHLAEVVTSQLFVPRVEPSAQLEFRAGVRQTLLSFAARDDSIHVMEALASHYDDRMPAARTLLQALQAPDQTPATTVTEETFAFAELELAVLLALSGPYSARARRLRQAMARLTREKPAGRPPSDGPRRIAEPSVEGGGSMSNAPSSPPTREPSPTGRSNPITAISSIAALFGGQESGSEPIVWGNVPPRNGDFTGRDELLLALEQRLRTQSVTAVLPQALHGMGGVGKSQIAIEYAYRHRADYEVVWFIPAEQPAQILRSLIDLGERLGLGAGLEANTAVPLVQEALRAGTPYSNWLLIFDNAETLGTVSPYLPESGTGKVLVTSRNEQWTDIAEALEIDVFRRVESIELLRKRNPDITVEEADRLAEVLEDLPLAIGQATAWRAATRIPAGEYLRLLTDKRAELADQALVPGYEIAVAAAWTVALDRLGVENLAALQLLQACSFLAPEPISLELFLGPRHTTTSAELDDILQSPSRLNRAIREIAQYGLARIDYRDQTIQLHRLVKTVLVSQLSEREREDLQHAAHMLLAGGNPGGPGQRAQWQRYHALLPHVLAADTIGCEDAWARQLVLDIIEFLYFWGDYPSCLSLAQKVVEQWRGSLGANDLQTLKAARWLGYVERLLGNFSAAASTNADCLNRLQAILGPDDEETFDAMILVAADRRAAGDFAGARALDEEAFKAAETAFGPDYPNTLIAAHSLGVSLRLTGDFQQAFERDADTFRRRAEDLGADHPLTLLTLNGLTLDLRECGAYLQANTEQERVYERIQQILGRDHPNTLQAARNLAVSRRRAGQHESARKLAEDTMKGLQKRFGATHPDTIASALNYAVDLRENDDLFGSQALAEQTYQEYESTLGAEHPYTLYARTNLAIVLRLLGQLDLAYEHNSTAFDQLRQSLGRDHVLTLTCATNLASDLAARGDHEAARTLDAETLTLSRERLGAEHPSTLACLLNLSFDLTNLENAAEGERLFQEVLDAYYRVLGEQHPAIVAALARQRANCDVDPMPL